MAAATLTQIRIYFGYEKAGDFRKDWTALTEDDKAQIKGAFENGTMTY